MKIAVGMGMEDSAVWVGLESLASPLGKEEILSSAASELLHPCCPSMAC